MVRMEARARAMKRRKVGRVKAPARESKRERAGWGTAWWMCSSSRRAARALRAIRRRRLRSRRVDWARRWRRGRLGCEAGRPQEEVAILDMGASLMSMRAATFIAPRRLLLCQAAQSGQKSNSVDSTRGAIAWLDPGQAR